MELIDIGANLTHESFQHDFEDVIETSQEAGIVHIILTGTDLPTSEAARNMAQERPGFFSSTAGFHPHVAKDVSASDLEAQAQLAQEPEVVAVGETGLDYNRNFSPAADQIRVFEQQLELAVSTGKPVFLHQRDAHEDFFQLLKKYRPHLSGGVVHCFTDSERALRDYLELDMYIGITGWICDERRGQELQGLVKLIPDDRLLIETDAPYLLPRSLQPKPKSRRNEPRFLTEVLRVIAECRGQAESELARQSCRNSRDLFHVGR